jgi:hypothetical protein
VRSGSVREEEEEGRQVLWQAPSLRENIFPEIRQGRAWAKRANEGRWQPRKEWVSAVKKEEGGRWGRSGVGLGWPAGQGPGRARPVGRADLWENGKKSIPNLIFGLTRILEIKSRSFWGQEGLVKIPKILQNFIGILEMKRCELE